MNRRKTVDFLRTIDLPFGRTPFAGWKRNNRRYKRIEIQDTEKPAPVSVAERLPNPTPQRGESSDNRNSILASVALKAATATRGIAGEPQEIIETAGFYLTWLKSA